MFGCVAFGPKKAAGGAHIGHFCAEAGLPVCADERPLRWWTVAALTSSSCADGRLLRWRVAAALTSGSCVGGRSLRWRMAAALTGDRCVDGWPH